MYYRLLKQQFIGYSAEKKHYESKADDSSALQLLRDGLVKHDINRRETPDSGPKAYIKLVGPGHFDLLCELWDLGVAGRPQRIQKVQLLEELRTAVAGRMNESRKSFEVATVAQLAAEWLDPGFWSTPSSDESEAIKALVEQLRSRRHATSGADKKAVDNLEAVIKNYPTAIWVLVPMLLAAGIVALRLCA